MILKMNFAILAVLERIRTIFDGLMVHEPVSGPVMILRSSRFENHKQFICITVNFQLVNVLFKHW